MGDELFLAPEITMHEEPGQITINQGQVSVEIDDDEPEQSPQFPFANGDIPPEISITKVTGSSRAQLTNNVSTGGGPRPLLKVRSDLGAPVGGQQWPPQQRLQRPVQVRPPPLVRGGNVLPPMPRLKFGGPSRPSHYRSSSPLVGMMNMMSRPQHMLPHMGMIPPQQGIRHGGMRPVMRGGMRPPPMNSAFNRRMPNMGSTNGHPRPMVRPAPHQVQQQIQQQIQLQLHQQMQQQMMQHQMQQPPLIPPPPPPASRTSPTVLQVPSPAFSKMAASTQLPPRSSFPPPMIKPGNRSLLRHPPPQRHSAPSRGPPPAQVRTVFVPPPMKNYENGRGNQQQLQQQQHLLQQQQQEEIDDDEDFMLDEDELDDVEPDVDPHTFEVDDVEPSEAAETAAAAARGNGNVANRTEVRYVRSADGKSFVRKIVDGRTLKKRRVKKKKKKAFRGCNYRFDGTSIKKRGGKRPTSAASDRDDENGDGATNGDSNRDPSDVLAYLGIQRKDSTECKTDTNSGAVGSMATMRMTTPTPQSVASSGQKAKKSFKTPFGLPSSISISRNSSTDDAASVDSSGSLKRRLSLSEVMNNQKKLKSSDGGLVRHSIGGGGGIRVKDDHTRPMMLSPKVPKAVVTPPKTAQEDEEDTANRRLRQRKVSEQPAKKKTPIVETPLQTLICQCARPDAEITAEAAKKPGVANLCQAVETVGGHRVGCKNKVDDFKLRRCTPKAKGKVLCAAHVKRMQGHHACAFCGDFCAHGLFLMCRPMKKAPPHFFHKTCFLQSSPVAATPGGVAKRKCPHCKSMEHPLTVQLKLSMAAAPLNLLQMSSRMSFPKNRVKKSDLILKGDDVITYKLSNGTIISSEGLPQGIENEALEKVLSVLEDSKSLKHATRNMYIPVKSGDNVKLLQLLSLGYSANQRFTEADGGTPLHVAASEGHSLTAHILIQAGSELDMLDDEQNSPLMLASIKGRTDVTRYLLQAGADLTLKGDDGMTCLHLATQSGHLECAHLIMNQTNLPRGFINMQDEGGWTPLVWACENKHETVIRYLLERGADPLITDAEGNIALHWAALSGSMNTCERLLNAGCDVNGVNSIGETPMHISLRQDHYECAVLFLMRGARLDMRNNSNQLPSECFVSKDVKSRTIVRLSTMLQGMMRPGSGLPGIPGGKDPNAPPPGDPKDPANKVPNFSTWTERIVSNDVSGAKENNPIQCVNGIDESTEPTDYVYIKDNCVTAAIPIDRNISKLQHCQCLDTCSSEDTCHCSDLSVKSWYDREGRLKDGFDYKEPPLVFECNSMCKCNVSMCHNRVIQHGITVRLQVFRTYGMGWGVRALADIPKGSFVCEYVGEIISDSEADTREDSYLFDLDNRDGETFCIDANRYANIARFINHSCLPNVVPVKVFADHQDLRFPHIALFASRDIPKGQELGFDYGEKFWVIKHKYFTCHCGSEKCRYNKSSIHSFLREYYARTGEEMPEELLLSPQQKKEAEKEKKKAAAAASPPKIEAEREKKKAAAAASPAKSEVSPDASKKDQTKDEERKAEIKVEVVKASAGKETSGGATAAAEEAPSTLVKEEPKEKEATAEVKEKKAEAKKTEGGKKESPQSKPAPTPPVSSRPRRQVRKQEASATEGSGGSK